MTREDIIRMAREARFRVGPSKDGPDDVWGVGANLERFAKLVAEQAKKEALAQTEQEPICPDCKAKVLYECVACSSNNYPPQCTWVGLKEEEVDEIYTSVQEEVNKHWDKGGTTMFFPFTLYKALEQALKEKNA